MTANAGKGADGDSGRTTGKGGKGGAGKRTSAANKPPTDEVTVKKTDDKANGAEPADRAEDTVIDLAAKKDGSEDTVQDLKLPSKKPDPTGDAAGSKDRLVSRGSKSSLDEGSTTGTSTARESGSPAGRTTSMDIPKTSPGFGSAGSTAGSTGPSSYGSASSTALEPAPRPADATPPGKSSGKAAGRKAPRKAHLQVARFEPWSVMKFSFIMSLVCFLVLFVAVTVLYLILSALGVFDALTNTIKDLQGKTSGGLNPASWFSAARILGYTALIGTLNVLLITALATVWSVIYNMAADLVGGVEVTLKEADQ
ncbi:DUF3566 domain-containing protein [Actinoallomurus rhizosphaericola]|uniref:DUF3566 domain-containing protein n=1 Tax=Actinoallomurus rhizosphaericola TaxID=2952536 RepID=UPI0027E324E6|nr:DUF3566 domain-containing protein [Actinoallomurus rhizosphaericola]